jgi:hypothetical protein
MCVGLGVCQALRRAPFSFVSFLLGEQKKRKRYFRARLKLKRRDLPNELMEAKNLKL